MSMSFSPTFVIEKVAAGPVSVPTWLQGAAQWQWLSISGTNPSSLTYSPSPPGTAQQKVFAWNGACVKRSGSKIIRAAVGGHSDYAGNEVEQLTLSANAPAWQTLLGPSPNSAIHLDVPYYDDGRPASRHTYRNNHYFSTVDKVIMLAEAAAWGTIPYGSLHVDGFSLATNTWDPAGTWPESALSGSGPISCLCVLDPINDIAYMQAQSDSQIYAFNPAIGWSHWNAVQQIPDLGWCGAVDTLRNKLFAVGTNGGTQVFGKSMTLPGGAWSSVTLTGVPLLLGSTVVYEDALDKFLVFSGGQPISIVDPVTYVVTAAPVTGVVPPLSPALGFGLGDSGIHTRFILCPELKGCAYIGSYTGNVNFILTRP